MRIFVDTANLADIEDALSRGFVGGVTTNPTLLSREERRDYEAHIQDIILALHGHGEWNLPLSIEVLGSPRTMMEQAERFLRVFEYASLYIKVPIGWDELQVIHEIRRAGGKVNCTCCMSYNQAIMAAAAGANFVSLFWGRIRDTGYDAASVVRQVHQTFVEQHVPCQIIVGSIRQMIDVNEAFQAGADIVTVPPKFLRLMCEHPKTDEAVAQFVRDFAGWSAVGWSEPPSITLAP